MALGDGVRRNIRTLSVAERERFTWALLTIQGKTCADEHVFKALGGSDWMDLEALRTASDAHRGAEFLPWHRELCNRFEEILRRVDPELSLHYWDWNDDPRELFAPIFGPDGGQDLPFETPAYGEAWAHDDVAILASLSYQRMSALLESKHDAAHFVYFGGTFVNGHVIHHDPWAFLLLSNVDRLYAMWQAHPEHPWRLDPGQVYGSETQLLRSRLIEPWSTALPARPWLANDTGRVKSCAHASVVAPPCYDTMPTRVAVDPVANPGQVIEFKDVYAGKTFARAASFQVHGSGNLTFEVTSGPTGPYTVITPRGTVVAAHSPRLYQEARIWFGFTGRAPYTSAPAGAVTIRCRETGQEFAFTLRANTVPAPATGVVLSVEESRPEASGASRWPGVTWTWTWRPAH